MKILVTGGTGFVGKPLVRGLVAEGHEVVVFARQDDIDRPDRVKMVTGDVSNKVALRRAFSSVNIVYHLAASNDDDDHELFDTNVKGTQKVVELCKEKKVKHLIFISSGGVVNNSQIPVKEHSRYAPRTKFDTSKAKAERIIKDSGINYTIIRAPTVIGASIPWYHIFEAIKSGHPIIGDGENKFHTIHVDDIVRMLMTVLNNRNAYNNIFNVGTKDLMTYESFYETACKLMKVKYKSYRHPRVAKFLASIHWTKTAIQAMPTSPHMSMRHIHQVTNDCALSIKKAKEVLGFEPYYTTPVALNMTLNDLKP